MPVPPRPVVPDTPVALYVQPLLELQGKIVGWARWSVLASLVIAAGALALSIGGTVYWPLLLPVFVLPLVPIAAQTRAEELGRKIMDQLRDQQNERQREQALRGGRDQG